MKSNRLSLALLLATVLWSGRSVAVRADGTTVMSIPAVTLEDKQTMYDTIVEARTGKIMTTLGLTDLAVSNRVHQAIVAHYHALRARDEAISYELARMVKGSDEWGARRLALFPRMSQPLHEVFLTNLAADLSPTQIEAVEDRMTYGKVAFTFNAYCNILPRLTDEEKAHVLALLKQAREVAVDGGSSGEKTAIFQDYKNQINNYLNDRGYDVTNAIQAWTARNKSANTN